MGLSKRMWRTQIIVVLGIGFALPYALFGADGDKHNNSDKTATPAPDKCVQNLTLALEDSKKEPIFKNEKLSAEYQKILKDLSCSPAARAQIPTQMLHFLAAVKRSVRALTDHSLEERAQVFTSEAISKNGYLTGLTPAAKITKVAQLIEQCLLRGATEGSALESVTGNLRITESLQEYILQPKLELAELSEVFTRWAVSVEVAEVFKELTKRVEQKIKKHPLAPKYREILRELEHPLKDGENAVERTNALSTELVKGITRFSDRALYHRLQTITDIRIKKKGYLPGLTREYGIDSLEAMLRDFKVFHDSKKSALWSVLGSFSANDVLKRSFSDPAGLTSKEIAEDYIAWAEDVEANELYKELFSRLANGSFKP